jgi:hypothetical protein
MEKVKSRKPEIKVTEHEVPSYFGFDTSIRGRIVDILTRDEGHRGRTVRDQLYDEDEYVPSRIRTLEQAYETADLIMKELGYPNVEGTR